MQKSKNSKNQKGQALIIILLVMSVVLTVVLSSVSRSTTEVVVTGYEEEALRAFSAAEAGVEEKLLNPVVSSDSPVTLPDSQSSYQVDVVEHSPVSGGGGRQILYPGKLSSGEVATLWLVSQNDDGEFVCGAKPCWEGNRIRICYGEAGASPTPAMEVAVYYDPTLTHEALAPNNNFENVEVYRAFFDEDDDRRDINKADEPDNAPCNFDDGTKLARRATIDLAAPDFDPPCPAGPCVLMVKVRMLYANDQPVGFWPQTSVVPAQGVMIKSEGTAGESSRKIEVYRGKPEVNPLFDSAVFSLKGLTKN